MTRPLRRLYQKLLLRLLSPVTDDLKVLMRQLQAEAMTELREKLELARSETSSGLERVGRHAVEAAMQTRSASQNEVPAREPGGPAAGGRARVAPFSEYLERFRQLHPHLYETWASINFNKNISEFRERPEFSCAIGQRPDARLFGGFAAPYLRGRVLDVGCGPYATPLYLRGYPAERVAAIDPLEPFEPHPFEFVQGFAEFLPWVDGTFDVVIAATSLDHTLDLQLALTEIRRVLQPGGMFLIWEWFADQAEVYDPARKSPELIDRYHLFNFDRKWFEQVVCRGFTVVEHVKLFEVNRHYHFYALKSDAG